MFTQNKCLVHYCRNLALSTFDEDGNITDGKNYCLDHIPDPGKFKADIYKYISEHDKIVGLNVCGLYFSDIELSNKKFYGCTFINCTFNIMSSCYVVPRMFIFDFAFFNDFSFI